MHIIISFVASFEKNNTLIQPKTREKSTLIIIQIFEYFELLKNILFKNATVKKYITPVIMPIIDITLTI